LMAHHKEYGGEEKRNMKRNSKESKQKARKAVKKDSQRS